MWRKLRYTARYLHLFVKRYGLLLVVGVILGGLGFWLFPRVINKLPKIRSTQSIGLIGRYDQNSIPEIILRQVSIGLTQIDEQGHPYPGLAESWQTKDDGKTWIFDLDNQITWSDGQPIQADQIKFNFKDVEINAPDMQQLQFKLQDPYSPFPSVVSAPVLRDNYTGIGPYKFSNFKRFSNFFKSISLVPINKESQLPNLKYIFYGTEDAAITAFKLGEVNSVIGLLDVQEFNNWPNLKITEQINPNRFVALFFNLNKPNFKEKTFRQALAYAIKDKSGSFQRVLSPIIEESWAYNPHIKPYDYDLDRAKNLNGEADNAEAVSVQISTVPYLLSFAERIAADWTEFGINTQVRIINTVPDDFDVLLVTQEVPTDPDQYVLWHSTQPTNLTKYQSPKVDKLLEDGRKELDPDKRLEIYQDFQRFLVEDVPAIFLFRPVTYTISRT